MRDLQKSDRNEIVIDDTRSGSELLLYYSTPTTKQQVSYQKQIIKQKGKKVVNNAFQTRLDHGLEIITGFRKGDFGVNGKPISSDEGDPDYREDWKDLLEKTAADIVTAVSFAVFEGATANSIEDIEEEEEEGETKIPLSKSSEA